MELILINEYLSKSNQNVFYYSLCQTYCVAYPNFCSGRRLCIKASASGPIALALASKVQALASALSVEALTTSLLDIGHTVTSLRRLYILRPWLPEQSCVCWRVVYRRSIPIRYDTVYLTCSKKLMDRQLSLPHGTNKKYKRKK